MLLPAPSNMVPPADRLICCDGTLDGVCSSEPLLKRRPAKRSVSHQTGDISYRCDISYKFSIASLRRSKR